MSSENWLQAATNRVVEWAESKGWEPDPTRTFGDEIALLHSELSEALEAYRDYGLADMTDNALLEEPTFVGQPKPEGVGSELADVLIRLLHYSAVRGIDLEWEFIRKMTYNESRPYRHGGKLL